MKENTHGITRRESGADRRGKQTQVLNLASGSSTEPGSRWGLKDAQSRVRQVSNMAGEMTLPSWSSCHLHVSTQHTRRNRFNPEAIKPNKVLGVAQSAALQMSAKEICLLQRKRLQVHHLVLERSGGNFGCLSTPWSQDNVRVSSRSYILFLEVCAFRSAVLRDRILSLTDSGDQRWNRMKQKTLSLGLLQRGKSSVFTTSWEKAVSSFSGSLCSLFGELSGCLGHRLSYGWPKVAADAMPKQMKKPQGDTFGN